MLTILSVKSTQQSTKAMNIPTYDFPHSPILWLGLGGILFTLVLYYVNNRAYTISPFNDDNQKTP